MVWSFPAPYSLAPLTALPVRIWTPIEGEFVSKVKNSVSKKLTRGLQLLPIGVLGRAEAAIQTAQGKGWGGSTVDEEVQAALSLLPSQMIEFPIVLDVGANVGAWSAALLLATPSAQVYQFEPSAAAFAKLEGRFVGDDRAHQVHAALGQHIGSARLWADAPGSGLGSLYNRRMDHFGINFTHFEEVPLQTLDSWRLSNQVDPSLLKLDVEGHELAVLRGASETLKSVCVVQFEFGGCNIDSRTFFQDYFYFFREAGFRILRLGPKGLEPIDRYREIDEVFTTTNFFAQRI